MQTIPNASNLKIYNVSVGKNLPDWLAERRKRSIRKSKKKFRSHLLFNYLFI